MGLHHHLPVGLAPALFWSGLFSVLNLGFFNRFDGGADVVASGAMANHSCAQAGDVIDRDGREYALSVDL